MWRARAASALLRDCSNTRRQRRTMGRRARMRQRKRRQTVERPRLDEHLRMLDVALVVIARQRHKFANERAILTHARQHTRGPRLRSTIAAGQQGSKPGQHSRQFSGSGCRPAEAGHYRGYGRAALPGVSAV